MDTVNKKYEIEIEVLTPVSIGTGAEKEWVKGVDFLIADGKIYKLNLQKMLALQQASNPADGIDRITNIIAQRKKAQQKSEALTALLGDNLDKVSDQIIPLPAQTDSPIKTCIKNELSNRPIIPGSSLKGAIRSHIYNYLEVKDKKESDVFGSMKTGEDFMRFLKIGDAEFEQAEFVNTKIFNLMKESNGQWIGGWKHKQDKTTPDFQATGFNTLYEVLMPHAKGSASIMLSPKAYQAVGQRNKQVAESKKRELLDIETLFKIINENTARYLKKELAFFETYATHDEPCGNIMGSLEKLLQEVGKCSQENTSCILKMAAGSGFHAITGDWQFTDFTKEPLGRKKNEKAKPKSRKVALYGNKQAALMGFVKLRILSQEEIQQRETARKERAERQQREKLIASVQALLTNAKTLIEKQEPNPEAAQEITNRIANDYPEILQETSLATEYQDIEKGIADLLQQRQQEQARMEQYQRLLNEFKKAMENEDVELAEEKYQQACELVPDGQELASLRETLDELKYEKLIQAAEAAYETQDFSSALEKCEKAGNLFPLRSEHKDLLIKVNTAQKASKGLSVLEEKNEKGEYKTRDFKLIKAKTNDFLKKANLTRIPDDQIPILEATLKRVYAQLKPRDKKDWDDMGGLWTRDIMPWVGEEKMKGMFKKIIQNQQ